VRLAPRTKGRLVPGLATILAVGGAFVVACTLVARPWHEPFTSASAHVQGHELADQHSSAPAQYRSHPVPPRLSVLLEERRIASAARRYRRTAPRGGAIGRIVVPRLGLDMALENGTGTATLRKGPGRDPRTYMPGEGELVYIAGHRTTYLKPFARIDQMRAGDPITLHMPYGTFRYVVTGHEIVGANALWVLRTHHRAVVALQACHPRFSATHRYIAWAKLVRVTPRSGPSYDS
jgi:sortase A